MSTTRAHRITAALLLTAAAAGCTAQAKSFRTLELGDTELAQSSTNANGTWESAPFNNSVWIELSAGSSVKVAHPLGHKPTLVLTYLSFDGDDRKSPSTRRAFLGAGDVANFYDVGDKYVTVENRTQADFFLRLTLQ